MQRPKMLRPAMIYTFSFQSENERESESDLVRWSLGVRVMALRVDSVMEPSFVIVAFGQYMW